MSDTDREIGRLDGRVGALEGHFERFNDKLDQINISVSNLALALAENKGSSASASRLAGAALAVMVMLGTWFAPFVEKLWHKG